MPRRRRPWGWLVAAALVAALIAIVTLAVRGDPPPDRPAPVVWNRESCAHCRMAVGEPRHAAQLVTRDGAVHNFDDPGCLLRYLSDHDPVIHRLWFHDAHADRWLGPDEVGFETGATTPMGWGLLATARRPGLLDLAAARAAVDANPNPRPTP